MGEREIAQELDSLLSTEAQPDQIERGAHAKKESAEHEVMGMEPVVQSPTSPAPEEKPGEKVAKNRPCGAFILFHLAPASSLGNWLVDVESADP